jgi:hypothetical protein
MQAGYADLQKQQNQHVYDAARCSPDTICRPISFCCHGTLQEVPTCKDVNLLLNGTQLFNCPEGWVFDNTSSSTILVKEECCLVSIVSSDSSTHTPTRAASDNGDRLWQAGLAQNIHVSWHIAQTNCLHAYRVLLCALCIHSHPSYAAAAAAAPNFQLNCSPSQVWRSSAGSLQSTLVQQPTSPRITHRTKISAQSSRLHDRTSTESQSHNLVTASATQTKRASFSLDNTPWTKAGHQRTLFSSSGSAITLPSAFRARLLSWTT